MLTSMRVNGFRSLAKFSIELGRGLNVLVGPNGSGKSNILDAISFSSDAISLPLSQAFRNQGGIAKVWRRSPDGRFVRDLSFDICGECGFDLFPGAENLGKILYEFGFVAKRTAQERPYYFSQYLRMRVVGDDTNDKIATSCETDSGWDVDIEYKKDEIYVNNFLTDDIGPTAFPKDGASEFQSILSKRSSYRGLKNQSIVGLVEPYLLAAYAIRNSSNQMKTFSIIPSRVRLGDDFTDPPRVRSDGRGLAAVISALENQSLGSYTPSECTDMLDTVNSQLALAVSSIESVKVMPDIQAGVLRLGFTLPDNKKRLVDLAESISENSNTILSGSVSDGTIKWVALVVCILTNEVFAIEEPENFLHPWMQQELVKMLKERSRGDSDFVSVLTTHSETLLNCIEPEDIIVVSHDGSLTNAKKIRNPKSLVKAINATGFGLGYYYTIGEF